MKKITHKAQQQIWEKEHTSPYVLKQMDASDPSTGVTLFYQWLQENNYIVKKGIEIGCGKGRNVIWLAQQGIQMHGLDFSPFAIKQANIRAKQARVEQKCNFLVHDATKDWPYKDNTFDIAIDCFATTDIESKKGREFAVREIIRILKPGGYMLVYVMSTDDEFHKQMLQKSPADEKNAFIHPTTGKFEKIYERNELLSLYNSLILIYEKRIHKTTEFFGKKYACKHFWMIFQKKLL